MHYYIVQVKAKKVFVEMASFKSWLLKNVETRDKSSPDFSDLKHLSSIASFHKDSLAPARVSQSKPTQLFVSEMLQKEISQFDKNRLKSVTSEESEVKEDYVSEAARLPDWIYNHYLFPNIIVCFYCTLSMSQPPK